MSLDLELEEFKRNIDLREFAAAMGYQIDRRASWRGSTVMRNAAGDKIVIKVGGDQHFVYFSVRDESDNGSIIDFLQKRSGLKFGQVRKELRAWLGRPQASIPTFPKMPATPKDRFAVERSFYAMRDAAEHPYLVEHRRISPVLLRSDRFAGRIRIDRNGNAAFPHFDGTGLCGFELKNVGFTGFAPGGKKGLWVSHALLGDQQLVFSESAIDALSYGCLFPNERARYASIGGQVNPEQPALITSVIKRLPQGAEVVSAMDNDGAGDALARIIESAFAESGRSDLTYRTHFPTPAKDWNDVLLNVVP